MTSIYIHIPFCLSKCRYCGFNSMPVGDINILDTYTRCLVAEIRNSKFEIQNLETMFFGGGTPTVLSLGQIERILNALRKTLNIEQSTETTIEANPETLDAQKLQGLRELGFNRLSLGMQSFDDHMLQLMGRPHTAAQAINAYRLARDAGFSNIGVDLIFALPGQTMGGWKRDLEKIISLGPEHLSLYSLTYEKNAEFVSMRTEKRIKPCDEDLETEMYLAAINMMKAAGYEHYEVSNFARPGYRARHNLNYWRCGDYQGFGAGAHSHSGNRRWANHTDPAEYISAAGDGRSLIGFEETLTRGQQLFEAVFLGLRLVEGIDVAGFTAQWGDSPLARLPRVWEDLERKGLLTTRKGNVRLTKKGLLLSDSVLAELAPEVP
ncbi:MAG: radical SAM family heme chaperone HemW [Candidatus Edwardsbacteria bacterium]|nr:radical SAM family heme chaperone HemW [Candidatus Edwardsbacteria bacterium]